MSVRNSAYSDVATLLLRNVPIYRVENMVTLYKIERKYLIKRLGRLLVLHLVCHIFVCKLSVQKGSKKSIHAPVKKFKTLSFSFFPFYLYIYPPDSQESDGGAIAWGKQLFQPASGDAKILLSN